jgi:8-hydroxy-5-deazaflavin:NADPH oxidoreductase
MEYPPIKTIAILGGTGKEGKGLAYRWAKSGLHVFIGSRTPEKANEAANELSRMLAGKGFISGTSNIDAATRADIIVITVPYSAHRDTIESIKLAVKGKMLIDVTVPLVPPKLSKVQMPSAGSAAQEAHQILGEVTQVTSAFHNISHEKLMQDEPVDCEVLVTGTSKIARQETLNLVMAAGLIGWDAGPIENSVVVEGMTSVLIGINKEYGSSSAGIRITGVKPPSHNP